MALDTRNARANRDAQAEATARLLDGGFLRLYTGPRPADPDDPPRGTMLAELRFGTPAFEKSRAGQIIATKIIQASAADDTGRAEWFRTFQADGVTPVFDGTVGTSDANIVMNNANIQINAIVSISAFTYSVPAREEVTA